MALSYLDITARSCLLSPSTQDLGSTKIIKSQESCHAQERLLSSANGTAIRKEGQELSEAQLPSTSHSSEQAITCSQFDNSDEAAKADVDISALYK